MKTVLHILHSRQIRGFALPVIVLFLWWLATERQWVSDLVLVPFDKLFFTASDPAIQKSLWEGVGLTLSRLIQGCAIGIPIGLLLGVGMGLSPVFDRITGPSFHAFRQVAILAWIPLLTAWFGAGETCKVIFVAIASAKPVVMGAYEGVHSTSVKLKEVGDVLMLSRFKKLRYITIPSALPSIVTALQLSFIFSWFGAIGAEYVIGVMSGGIGSVVIAAQEHVRTDIVLLGVGLIAFVGIAMNKALRKTSGYFVRWKNI